ncbi:MAG: gluconate 2-dehydrogenase subunit 3 family protein [Acidimicrobiia bacterium]
MSKVNDHGPQDRTRRGTPVSRRGFLRLGGATAAAIGFGGVLDGCRADGEAAPIQEGVQEPQGFVYDPAPPTPSEPLDTSALHFFTADEAKTMDALVGRILPGTPDDPGGREANVVGYIDLKLGLHPDGFAQPTYRKPPFAESYEGPTPPGPNTDSRIYVRKDELDRYGYQSTLNDREMFRLGLAQLESLAKSSLGVGFASLAGPQQDQLIGQMADGSAIGFNSPTAKSFFKMLMQHIHEGFLSDPIYGGNKNLIGWKLVGYPGAQRAYTPEDIKGLTPRRSPRSIADLEAVNPGVSGGSHEVLPVSGSRNGNEGIENP